MIEKISGRISPEADKLLSDWISRSAENESAFETVTRIWDNTPDRRRHPETNTAGEWVRLQDKIKNQGKVQIEKVGVVAPI